MVLATLAGMLNSERVRMKRLVAGSIVFSVSFIVGLSAVPSGEFYWGKVEAQADIWHGVYKGRRCSGDHLDVEATREYERLLREELNFGIEVVGPDACSCGPRIMGYNETQFGRIERVHGAGTVIRIIDRVTERWRTRVDKADRQ